MRRILIQLDTDAQPSSFDRVVAVDAGVDDVFAYGGVTPENVTPLVHGAMFTRARTDLKNTAIFVGGSDVAAGEALLQQIISTFFGPMRVAVMMDANGSNTTAAAVVREASRHLELRGAQSLVLGGTGPVGQRAALLLCLSGAHVRLASRSPQRAESVCQDIRQRVAEAIIEPVSVSADDPGAALTGVQLLIAAGAAGVQFLAERDWTSIDSLRVAIDVNAVPPVGLAGIGVTDKAARHGNIVCYGAIGIGGAKMKLHKRAIGRLFESNELTLDTERIYQIAEELD